MSPLCFSGEAGFKVDSVEPNTFFAKMNLEAGDIINKINGSDIKNANQVMEFYATPNKVKSIVVTRNGKEELILISSRAK